MVRLVPFGSWVLQHSKTSDLRRPAGYGEQCSHAPALKRYESQRWDDRPRHTSIAPLPLCVWAFMLPAILMGSGRTINNIIQATFRALRHGSPEAAGLVKAATVIASSRPFRKRLH